MKNLSIVVALLALVTVGNSVLAENYYPSGDSWDLPNEPTNSVLTEMARTVLGREHSPPDEPTNSVLTERDTIDREYWNEEMIEELLDSLEFNKFAVICVYGGSMRELTLQINRKLNEARMLLANRNIPYDSISRGNVNPFIDTRIITTDRYHACIDMNRN